MNKTNSELDFTVLFKQALDCWPETVDTAQLYVNEDRPELYTVIGLETLGDSIADELSEGSDAVLMSNLCDAISSVIRSAALFCIEVKPALLRPNAVRENFENRLRLAATNTDLGWFDSDILLIQSYFERNKGPLLSL